MANKKITDLQLRGSVSDDLNIPGDDSIQTYRVTAAQIYNYIYGLLTIPTAKIVNDAVTSAKINATRPTIQTFTSGSGTYTTPAGCKWIRVTAVGGGGGGGGSGTTTTQGNGGAGGNTTFGSSLIVAGGGAGGQKQSGGALAPALGGTASLGTGPIGIAIPGGASGAGIWTATAGGYFTGGVGGCSFLGGAGGSHNASSGGAAVANSGSGGGGGGANANSLYTGSGGGAGGAVQAIITAPSSTYAYSVGAAGSAGSAGTSGYAGGAGAAGIIIVEEHYV